MPNFPHHVTQRGNNQQRIFMDQKDYLSYLGILKSLAPREAVRIFGYCLMLNHVHLIIIPERDEALGALLKLSQQAYSLYFNDRHERNGHLWQERFYSNPMDEEYCERALKYIEENPVRAGFVEKPWDYRWSSCGEHVKKARPSGLLDLKRWFEMISAEDWMDLLAVEERPEITKLLRENTRKGIPTGNHAFVRVVEAHHGHPVIPRPRGRPKNSDRHHF